LIDVDWIFHMAGINRPKSTNEFSIGNSGLTDALCNAIRSTNRNIPIVFASSIQATLDNEYGLSKKASENALIALRKETNNPIFIYRLPNVFGKFARPNYNSVVATFCFNIARDLPVTINDPSANISLIYIDDVIESFDRLLTDKWKNNSYFLEVGNACNITVGELADQIYCFKSARKNLIIESVGTGFKRALYATYISYLPPSKFSYTLEQHNDDRGQFVEILKTKDSGQFSFFTAYPGVTRGGHYHQTKTEKFLVIRGQARFSFRNMITGEFYELYTSGDVSEVVETIPGWAHDVTNVGNEELICVLWANEIFDREKPDTYTCPVNTDVKLI